MKRAHIVGALALAAAIALPASAQDFGNFRPKFGPMQTKPPEWRGGGPNNQKRNQNRPHIGQWLQKNQNLPVDQQVQSLQNDPDFQKLSQQQQQRLLDRLKQFNALPPTQRQRMLTRMDAFEHLTPEQQNQARQIFTQVRQMPDDRRQLFRRATRQLADAPADQRQAMLDSPEFRATHTDNERDLMRQIVKLDVLPPKGEGQNPPPPPPDRR